MPIKMYHRPNSLDEALKLLDRTDVRSAVVAGGTRLNPNMDADVDEVVDLQAIGLERIDLVDNRLSIGAMSRLGDIADFPGIPDLLNRTIRNEAPNTFRNMATIGGCVASCDWESEILAALLVMNASLTIQSLAGSRFLSLEEFLASPSAALEKGIISNITLVTDGETALQRVARTPMDRPIVAVCGRKGGDGAVKQAFCGIANTPLLLDPAQLESLDPPADFRGSSAYRRRMAITLSQRIISSLA